MVQCLLPTVQLKKSMIIDAVMSESLNQEVIKSQVVYGIPLW